MLITVFLPDQHSRRDFKIAPIRRSTAQDCSLGRVRGRTRYRRRLSRSALPPDEIMQAGGGDAGGLTEFHRLDLSGRDQLIELGPADTDHAGGVVHANADRIGGKGRGHVFGRPASSAR